jgi:hypothetical protein
MREITAIGFVSRNALIVVEEVPATEEDRLAVIDLYGSGMVRGMPMHDVDAGAVDKRMSEGALLFGDCVTPVRTPMDRQDDDVVLVLTRIADPIGDCQDALFQQIGEQVDPGTPGARGPACRNAAG